MSMCVCASFACSAYEDIGYPWNSSYKQVYSTIRVLGIKPGSERAAVLLTAGSSL